MAFWWNLLLVAMLGGCSGCREKKVTHRYNIFPGDPSDLDFKIINITPEQAQDLSFWNDYQIDDDFIINPIKQDIISNLWGTEHNNILIALILLLSNRSYVSTINCLKNNSPLNKLLFFISNSTNWNQNISKFEPLFIKLFLKELQEDCPDDWEGVLKDPDLLKKALYQMIIKDIQKETDILNNADSLIKANKLTHHKMCARLSIVPDTQSAECVNKDLIYLLHVLVKNETAYELLVNARREFLAIGDVPDLTTLKDVIIQVLSEEKIKAVSEILGFKIGQKVVDEVFKYYASESQNLLSDFTSYITKLIEAGKGEYCSIPLDKIYFAPGEKNFFYEDYDSGIGFGNKRLGALDFNHLSIDLDRQHIAGSPIHFVREL